MSRSIFSNEALAAWLEKQPADGTYNYQSPDRCLISRFLRSSGMAHATTYYDTWWAPGMDDARSLPPGWDRVSRGRSRCYANSSKSWTYGAALERLRALMQEKVDA